MSASGPSSGFHLHETAASDQLTCRALVAARRSARITAVAGTLCLVGFFVAAALIGNNGDALRQSGGRTEGRVVVLNPDSGVNSGGADVRYSVDGTTFTRPVDLGADADNYTKGQLVTVHYELGDPENMTIDNEDNQPAWTVLPMIVALLAGLGAPPTAIVLGLRYRRTRNVLRSRGWSPVRVSVPSAEKGRGTLFTVADGSVWRSRMRWPTPNREPRELAGWGLPDEDPATVPGDQAAWCVSDGRFAVFSPDRGAPLVLARRRDR